MNAQHGLRHRRGGGGAVRRLPLLLILAMVAAALLLPARLAWASSIWQTAPALPQALGGLAATTASDGTIYAIGGGSTVYTLKPGDTTWQTAPSLPAGRNYPGAATGKDGTIYAIGGFGNGSTPQSTVYSFKPGTDTTWKTTAPSLPAVRGQLAATTGSDGTLYAIGGRDSSGNATSTVYSFKPGTDASWQTMATGLPAPRKSLAATTGSDGTLYAIGGVDSSGNATSTVYSFKPGTDASWQTAPSLPHALYALAATTGADGTLYAIGGDNNGALQSTVYSFKPGTDASWQTAPSLPQALFTLAATTGKDGTLYAIGGQDASVPGIQQSTVYSYTPGTPLTITANNQTMPYGGTVPNFTAKYSGFVNNDTSAVVTGLTCGATDTSGNPVSSTTPVGTYPITCSGATASGYAITYVAGTLTITPATLTITANSPSMTYGAATIPAVTCTPSGFVGSDTFVTAPTGEVTSGGVPLTVSATTAAGTYTSHCTGADAGKNYTISYVAGTLTITQATPQISWTTPADIPYGTALSATQLDATATLNATTVAGTFVYTPAAGTVLGAGSGQTLSVSFTPTDTTDFTAPTASVPINVTQAPLTITALDQHSTYGTTTADLTPNSTTVTYDGFVNGDTAASLTTPAQLRTTATKATPVGTYPITVDSATAANYSITFVPGTLHVDPAPLTITPTNLTMTYKGTVPAYTWTANFVNGDTLASLTTQPTCVATDGSGNSVSASTPAGVYPITCTGAVDPNYTISYKTGTLTVLYGTGGYLQPVNDTAHGETCGSPCPMSVFKAGQTIPFKFQILDANGTVVGPDANPVTFTATYAGTTSNPVDESTLTDTATTGTTFTWNGTMYQYNWKSPSQSGSLYLITATFANGQTIQVTIGLR